MVDLLTTDETGDSPFRAVHRHGRLTVLGRAAVAALLGAAVVVPLGGLAVLAPAQNPALITELAVAEAQRITELDARLAVPQGAGIDAVPVEDPAAEPATVVIPAEPSVLVVPPVTAVTSTDRAFVDPPPAAASYATTIEIDVVGYQEEIDRCLWVKMSLGAPAPIVAAHNYCGGDVVLDLRTGDLVRLTGFELDGDYIVTGAREVTTGEKVSVATKGLVGDVILQTCFWHSGTTRLVTLDRVG